VSTFEIIHGCRKLDDELERLCGLMKHILRLSQSSLGTDDLSTLNVEGILS